MKAIFAYAACGKARAALVFRRRILICGSSPLPEAVTRSTGWAYVRRIGSTKGVRTCFRGIARRVHGAIIAAARRSRIISGSAQWR